MKPSQTPSKTSLRLLVFGILLSTSACTGAGSALPTSASQTATSSSDPLTPSIPTLPPPKTLDSAALMKRLRDTFTVDIASYCVTTLAQVSKGYRATLRCSEKPLTSVANPKFIDLLVLVGRLAEDTTEARQRTDLTVAQKEEVDAIADALRDQSGFSSAVEDVSRELEARTAFLKVIGMSTTSGTEKPKVVWTSAPNPDAPLGGAFRAYCKKPATNDSSYYARYFWFLDERYMVSSAKLIEQSLDLVFEANQIGESFSPVGVNPNWYITKPATLKKWLRANACEYGTFASVTDLLKLVRSGDFARAWAQLPATKAPINIELFVQYGGAFLTVDFVSNAKANVLMMAEGPSLWIPIDRGSMGETMLIADQTARAVLALIREAQDNAEKVGTLLKDNQGTRRFDQAKPSLRFELLESQKQFDFNTLRRNIEVSRRLVAKADAWLPQVSSATVPYGLSKDPKVAACVNSNVVPGIYISSEWKKPTAYYFCDGDRLGYGLGTSYEPSDGL